MSMITDPRLEVVLTAKDMASGAFKKVEQYTTSLSKRVFSLSGALTALAGASGMGYVMNQSLALTAEMKKNADMAGVSAKAYQELAFAAGKYQVTQDALMDGMKELSLRADEFVITGAGPAKEAFERLGFSQAELNKKMKDTPALLLDIIDRMQGLGDAAKIRIADEIFGGTGGEQFVSMINAGSGAIESLTKQANDLGLVMSDKTAQGAVDAYNAVQTLSKQLQTQFNTVVAELAPDLGDLATHMSDWVSQNKTFLTQDVPDRIRDTATEIGKIKDIYDALPDYITGPAGMGLIGTMALGRTPGKVIFVLSAINAAMHETGNGLQDIVTKYYAVNEATVNLWNSIVDAMGDGEAQAEQTFHAIDKNTEGFKRYSKGAGEAGDATGDLTGDTNELTDAMKRARDSLKDLQVQAALDEWGFEDLDNYAAHLDEKTEMGARAEESLADIRIQQALDSYFEDIDNYDQHLKDKADAEEKARKEAERAEEKARQEYEREWERVYDDMHKFAADTFYDIFDGQLDSFEDFADQMLNIFKRMLANMVAEAAMTNIFGPIMNSMAGSSLGGLFGLPSMPSGGSGGSLSNISSLKSIYGAGSAFMDYGWAGLSNTYLGTSYAGMSSTGGIGAAAGAYQGPGMGAAISGTPSGGAAAGGGMAGGLVVGGAAAVFAMVGAKLVSDILDRNADKPATSFAVHDPGDPAGHFPGSGWLYGAKRTDFDFRTGAMDTGQDPAAAKAVSDYFEQVFTMIEETTMIAMNDVLKEHQNFSMAVSGVDLKALSKGVFDEMIGSMLLEMFPDAGTIEQEYEYGTGKFEKYMGGRDGMVELSRPILETASREVSALVEHINEEFFKAITPEGGNEWDAFMQFATVVENIEGFIEDFTRRIEELGQTSVDAYQQIQLISGVLAEMDMAIEQITGSAVIGQINALSDTWNAYIDVMKQANATVDQLTEAEQKKATVLGAQLTGLTASSVQQAILSGGDIQGVMENTIKTIMAGQMAETLMETYISELNAAAWDVFEKSGRDLAAVAEYLEGYDFSEIEAQIRQVFGTIEDTIEESLADLDAAVASAASDYRSALERELSDAQARQAELVANFESAQADLARAEARQRQRQIDEARAALQEEQAVYAENIRKMQARVSDLGRIFDSLTGYSQSMMVGPESPYLPDELLKIAKDQFTSASAEDMPGAARTLLDAARNALTDPEEYNRIFDEVKNRIESEAKSVDRQIKLLENQIDYSEAQLELKQQELDMMAAADEQFLSYSDAAKKYMDAKQALDESQWASDIAYYETELAKLDNIYNATLTVAQALRAYQSAVEKREEFNKTREGKVLELYKSIGREGFGSGVDQIDKQGYAYWTQQAAVMSDAQLNKAFYDSVERYKVANPNDPYTKYLESQGFASGGIATGPESGYPVTLHGTEAIIPLENGYVPVSMAKTPIDPEVKQLLATLISEVRADKDLSKKIHRVLDRVTAGSDSFQTRAED